MSLIKCTSTYNSTHNSSHKTSKKCNSNSQKSFQISCSNNADIANNSNQLSKNNTQYKYTNHQILMTRNIDMCNLFLFLRNVTMNFRNSQKQEYVSNKFYLHYS